MRKIFINENTQDVEVAADEWLNLDLLAAVEVTSENIDHPVESALLPGKGAGWLAGMPGKQIIRLRFDAPQQIRRIALKFIETDHIRTQEFVLRGSSDGGKTYREIVRQQWNFSAPDATVEEQDFHVDLPTVTVLELSIIPDISGKDAVASLAQLRLA